MAIDPGYGAYLKSNARYVTANIADTDTAWPGKAKDTTVVSPIALKADAQTEVVRQAQFLAGPFVRDKHVIRGLRRDLIGQCITIVGDRLGYEAGRLCFVLGVVEDKATSTLDVLRRL